jgi:pre-rRNA-processing protein IPI3
MGHSASGTDICVSASKDNTVVVWDYHSGDLLRTFLLPFTPLCLALDPCDRAVYIGFEDGSVQLVEFSTQASKQNQLYDKNLQSTPVQVTLPPWIPQAEPGPALCLGLSYDGTCLLSGHASGRIIQWDTPRRVFTSEFADLNAPVTNLLMFSPFPTRKLTKPLTVVKPKLGEGSYIFTGQLLGSIGTPSRLIDANGFPDDLLERAVASFSTTSVTSSSSGDVQLEKQNEELWKIVNEQRAVQKKTWDRYTKLKSAGVQS